VGTYVKNNPEADRQQLVHSFLAIIRFQIDSPGSGYRVWAQLPTR
jgi:hypothetical protein